MKGAGELLTWLQEKGVKIALASSTGRERCSAICAERILRTFSRW